MSSACPVRLVAYLSRHLHVAGYRLLYGPLMHCNHRVVCICPCMLCVLVQGIKLYWHVLGAMLKAEEARAGLPAAGKCYFVREPSTGLSALVPAWCVMAPPGILSKVLLRSS